ncbi:MAG: response regulator [Anaerolineae bacterium]|nr:response regulator [Anaerolineae bacterium]
MATILIVDDDPQVLGTVRRILSRESHSVIAFSSGPLALNHAIKNPPDLIILDIIMPDIDGLALCKTLRAAQPTARVPILFLTVRSSAQELAEALDCGGDDCLRKPFASSELAARVRALLRRAVRARRAHHADPNWPEVAPAAALPAYTPPRAAFRLIPERREAQVDGRSVTLTPDRNAPAQVSRAVSRHPDTG